MKIFQGNYIHKILVFITVVTLVIVAQGRVVADENSLEEINKQISDLQNQLQLSINATTPLEEEVGRLETQINSIQAKINATEQELKNLEESIDQREQDLGARYLLFASKVRDYHKKSQTYPFFLRLLELLSSGSLERLTRDFAYREATADEDKNYIISLTKDIIELEGDKERLEEDTRRLAVSQANLDKQIAFFEGEIAGAKKWQSQLKSQIATLTAQQQQLIAQKLGSLNLPQSLGAGPLYCTDDRSLNPGFSNAFAFYTFGIPHRVGMSQYGAYGRAQNNQSYDQILRAYYNFDNYENKGGLTIRVNNGDGVNQGSVIWEGSLEDYIKRIYEIPSSWPKEALKAQAIAARSYALATTNNGSSSICATQSCQVFKTDPKGGDWEQAVNETSGQVMVYGGQPITAWYASTAGGYTFTNADVWGGSVRPWTKRTRDTNGDVGSFGDLLSKAYDKDSPCMYSAQGWRSQYSNSAWLKGEELADIVNVILLARADSSTKDHLYQTDKPHPYGGEVWDEAKVRQELQNRGGTPLTNVTSASITGVDWGAGITTGVSVGGHSFSGTEFSDWFNLRAPANIQIVGPLFNIEKK